MDVKLVEIDNMDIVELTGNKFFIQCSKDACIELISFLVEEKFSFNINAYGSYYSIQIRDEFEAETMRHIISSLKKDINDE